MKLEQWLKPLIVGLLFTLPILLPFIVSGSLLFPYISGKNLFFRVIVELALGGWVALALVYPKYRPRLSPLLIAFLAFTGIIALADMLGENPMRSLWSNNERMEGLVTILHLLALFAVVAHTFTEKWWARIIQTSLGISVIVAIQGFVELGQGVGRIDGSFGNSTYLGVYALLHVFFALWFIVRELYHVHEGKQLRIEHFSMYGIVAVLNVITLYFTGTRGAVLGLAGGITVVAIIYAIRERKHKALRRLAFTLLALELLTGVFLLSIHGTEFVKAHPTLERFSNLVTAIVTLDLQELGNIGDARFNIWSTAFEGVKERPILGWGQDNFGYVFSKYYDPGLFTQEQWFDRTHNVLFDWLIAGGILGLLSYLSLFGTMMWMLWKNIHKQFTSVEQGMLTGLVVAYFIHNFFVFDNLVSYVFIVIVLAYIHMKSVKVEEEKSTHSEVRIVVPIIIGVITLALPFLVNAKGYLSSSTLIKALVESGSALQAGPSQPKALPLLTKSLEHFTQALDYGSYSEVEILEQLSNKAIEVQSSGFPADIKSQFVSLVEERYTAHIEKSRDARDHIIFGTFYARVGNFARSEEYLKKGMELSPKKQTMLFALAQVYSAQKKDKEALGLYKQAYELDTSFDEPKLLYALALSKSGDKEQANKLLSEIGEGSLLNKKYVTTYISLGRYDLVAKVFELMVKEDPKNVQLRVSLAAAYLETGNRAKSIEVLQSIIESNPEYKDQVNGLISEIKAGRNPIDK